jgi:polysaccharide chain length determinant protein (PEP-CTERM system associated)
VKADLVSSENPALEYLNAIYRYRLVAVCTLLVGLILTVVTVRALRDIYSSTTLIMVEPQDVPETYVKATVRERLDKRLQAMNEEILSRTRLETVINDLGLFSELRAQRVPMEKIVNSMQNRITVKVFPADNAFRITYEGEDPKTVQRVAARLASMYIDENLRMREAQASGTTEFLESELTKAKRHLEDQEAGIQAYKQQHMGELPEQREANMRALDGFRVQLQTVSAALSAAMERKLLLDKQAAEARSFQASQPPKAGQAETGAQTAIVSPRVRLHQLEAQLTELRSRYTDEHPDVVRTVGQIAKLKADLGADPGGADQADALLPPPLAQALMQTQSEIKRLQQDEERLKHEIEVYQQRIENTFVREQELKDLSRDYEVRQAKYQRLLDKKLEAQLSQSLEQRQKAERFRMLDPASQPQLPARPNRPLLMAAGVGLTIALALGLPILLWQLDTSFHSPEELSPSALPVLAVIPQLHTVDVVRRLRKYRLRVVAASSLALVVGLGTSLLYAKLLY